MHTIEYNGYKYRTARRSRPLPAIMFPTGNFYFRLFWVVYKASKVAQLGKYDGASWANDSFQVLQHLENAGVIVEISGLEEIERLTGPAVIIGNHMSMMETLLLPMMIRPLVPATFVVKESLLHYPIFKYIMRARNPVAVTRTNPRQDLKTVMQEGVKRLKNGISVIVFPQTTRDHSFDPAQMSSIGVKLAKKAGVPIIPLALKTDCWQNGNKFKDFGKLDVSLKAHFAFGEPFPVEGKGVREHDKVNDFVQTHLDKWS